MKSFKIYFTLSHIALPLLVSTYSGQCLADNCGDAALYCNGDPRNANMCSAAQLLCNNDKEAMARAEQTLKSAQENSKNQDAYLYRECIRNGLADSNCNSLVTNVKAINSSAVKASIEVENIMLQSKAWLIVKSLDGKRYAVPDACEQLDFQRTPTYAAGKAYHKIETHDTEVQATLDFDEIRSLKRVGVDRNNNKAYFRIELTNGQVADYTSISMPCVYNNNSYGSSAHTHINSLMMNIESITASRNAPDGIPKLIDKR